MPGEMIVGVCVCAEVLWSSQSDRVMSSIVNFWADLVLYAITSIVHILSPETDNCPS